MPSAVMTEVPQRESRNRVRVLIALVIGVLLGFGGVLVSSRSAAVSGWMTSLQRTLHIGLSQPIVVSHVQQLQRLETVSYTMDKIVTGGHESDVLPDFLAGDKLL